jgi:hypothetical protein
MLCWQPRERGGVSRFVAQSFASYRYARGADWIKTEEDPLDPTPPPNTQQASPR